MIAHEDMEALAEYNDSTGYWSNDEEPCVNPMTMVQYFHKFTNQEKNPNLYRKLIAEEYDDQRLRN